MITTGTKIQLTAPMGVFTNVGEICEIKEIMEDGTICFKFKRGLGYMSYDEYNKYFKPYVEPKVKKVVWSEWKKAPMTYISIEGKQITIPIKYRYNGHRVDLRTDYPANNLKVRASCHKTDNFVLVKGIRLACARLKLKLFTKELEEMTNNM